MADVRPVKPGIYSKIVDAGPNFDLRKIFLGDSFKGEPVGMVAEAKSRTEHDGVYIDSPCFAKKRAEYVAEDVKKNFEKYFLTPGSPDQMESFRVLVSQYAQCPLDWVKVTLGESGFDILISPDVPMECLSMEVGRET